MMSLDTILIVATAWAIASEFTSSKLANRMAILWCGLFMALITIRFVLFIKESM